MPLLAPVSTAIRPAKGRAGVRQARLSVRW
jgi:hypothetical protein